MNFDLTNIPTLVTVDVVLFLRRIINTNGAQRFLDKIGLPVDLRRYVEYQLQNNFPGQNSTGILAYISNNYTYFLTGDAVKVAKSINEFLLYDPKCTNIFGYPICIYSDPASLRKYAMYGAGLIVLYLVIKK